MTSRLRPPTRFTRSASSVPATSVPSTVSNELAAPEATKVTTRATQNELQLPAAHRRSIPVNTDIPRPTTIAKRKANVLELPTNPIKRTIARPTQTNGATTTNVRKAPTTGGGSMPERASNIRRKVNARTIVAPSRRTAGTQEPLRRKKTASSVSEDDAALRTNTGDNLDVLEGFPRKRKRSNWDTKGRLEDMEELTTFLKQQLKKSIDSTAEVTLKLQASELETTKLEAFQRTLEDRIAAKEEQNTAISEKLDEAKQALVEATQSHINEMDVLRNQHELEMKKLQSSCEQLKLSNDKLSKELKSTQQELTQSKQENTHLQGTIADQASSFSTLEDGHRALKTRLQQTEATLCRREQKITQLEQHIQDDAEKIDRLEKKVCEEETTRRRLHNTIQEMKGNIRVFCRVRPPTIDECSDGRTPEAIMAHMRFPSNEENNMIELVQAQESASGIKPVSKTYPFTFDVVFPTNVSQAGVFEEISQLVQSALDGYPVCIFAYGQTGSGKTYTMEGPGGPTEQTMGMIPRAVHQIFSSAKKFKEKGWEYVMEGQFVEIYNETIHDLLGNEDMSSRHEIKHQTNGRTIVTDVKTMVLDTPSKVKSMLKTASRNRAVAATLCNERSSRSHSVFTLRLTGRNSVTDETSEGLLNLIDLAGSERLSVSGSTGDRLRETQAINKSLSSLGDVIAAISNKDAHVPYRNSKLTYLLQNSLGGNSKTLMFVNISPFPESFQETLCSLRFATKVNSCHIGTARRLTK